MRIRVHLCGTLTVELDGHEVTASLPGRQGRRLFAYLVANAQRPVVRTELTDVLWPDAPPAAPEVAVRSLLTGIRRVIGRDALTGREQLKLDLGSSAWVDLDAARVAAATADSALAASEYAVALEHARTAVGLTSQPVLADMDGAWVDGLRGEADALHGDQLAIAARAAIELGGGDLATAERMARALIAAEPYRESAYALLMEALAAAGNFAEALRVYEDVRVLLRDELGASPSAALTALHGQLLCRGALPAARATRRQATRTEPVAPPAAIARMDRGAFVGRTAQLDWLRERWRGVDELRGCLVFLTGEAGIGKSRIAARFASEVQRTGAEVLYGRVDREPVVPYQPFVEALGPVSSRLGLPAFGVVEAAWGHTKDDRNRYELFDAAVTLVSKATRSRPLLLIVEDLQWAPQPTLLLLREIVRRSQDMPLMVLATYRPEEVGAADPLRSLIAELRRELVPHRLELRGLDAPATAELASAGIDHGVSSAAAGRLRTYTAGNPFFIEELLRSASERRIAVEDIGCLVPPETVQEAIMQRVARLTPSTVELLTRASLIGQEFALGVLVRFADRSSRDVLTDLEEAGRAGFVAEDAHYGRFSFCHGLVRETLYALPTAARRRRLHLAAGRRLEPMLGAGVRAAELARHYHEARHIGGAPRAVHFSRLAAHEAAHVDAHEEAARWLDRALEALALTSDDGSERVAILLELGAARWQAGERGARAAFMEAAELARRLAMPDALLRAALGAGGRFYAPGRVDSEYVALLEEALRLVDTRQQAVHARLLGRLGEALVGEPGGRPEALGAAAVTIARASGTDEALVSALLSRHATLLNPVHVAERIELAARAVASADRLSLHEAATLSRHWLIYDLIEARRLDEARHRHTELASLSRDLRQPLYVHAVLAWRGVFAQLDGRFEEAERLAREGFRLAERAGAPDASANFTAQLLATRYAQGRLAELLHAIERLEAHRSAVLPWRTLLPLVHLSAGDRVSAAALLREMAAERFAAIPPRIFRLAALAWLAEAAAELRETSICATLRSLLRPHADRLVQASFTGCWGSARHYVALLDEALGDHSAARSQLEAATVVHRTVDAASLVVRSESVLERLRSRRVAAPAAIATGAVEGVTER